MPASRTVNCPRCGTPVVWGPAASFRPFCSERCKMIDLGAWAAEKYKVRSEGDKEDERSNREDGKEG
jgi:endogenous inhibitor of DNA gyrase (YacG/DUF329 family)